MDGRKNKTLFHHSVFKEEVLAFSYIFCYAILFNPSSCESRAAWTVCTNFVAKSLQLSYPWLIASPGDYCPPLSKCLRVS
uniref:Uncharacterized protein n=1 Tax=Aotus nancymaae TaxID=37293 RepID=A0A2K5F817_AOTNA